MAFHKPRGSHSPGPLAAGSASQSPLTAWHCVLLRHDRPPLIDPLATWQVSKELATPGTPPMMLPCGHVLALGSVTKLARGTRSARFKCPYCPSEATIAAAQSLTI